MSHRENERFRNYLKLSSELAQIKDSDLAKLLSKTKTRDGWGTNHKFELAGSRIFAKKIPLTRLEYENSFDTRNLYRLPLYYQYGVGSAGFGAYRELLTHVKTTNWVLSGEHSRFPLMYHYRVLRRVEAPEAYEAVKHRAYVKRWNNSHAIDRYIRERRKAPFEIALFLEYFPQTLSRHLGSDSGRAQSFLEQMTETLGFLRARGILHFDAHLHNVLMDGHAPVLTDFGLAIDRGFDLSTAEKKFFVNHSQYDVAEFIGSQGMQLYHEFAKFSARKKAEVLKLTGATESAGWHAVNGAFLSHLDLLRKKKVFQMSPAYFKYLERHRETILFSNEFFYTLSRNPKKNTVFDHTKLKRLLARTL